jgi:hypothetical protein
VPNARLIPALFLLATAAATASLAPGCASGPAVKQQAYARLRDQRTLEYDFPTTWKGIESAVAGFKVTDRDPDEVEPQELRNLRERKLETDWIYSRSTDKYQEYSANGFPRKVFLQTRFRYRIEARSVLGGTDVSVGVEEEVERLNPDGSSDGYASAEASDPTRANEMIERIRLSILRAPA